MHALSRLHILPHKLNYISWIYRLSSRFLLWWNVKKKWQKKKNIMALCPNHLCILGVNYTHSWRVWPIPYTVVHFILKFMCNSLCCFRVKFCFNTAVSKVSLFFLYWNNFLPPFFTYVLCLSKLSNTNFSFLEYFKLILLFYVKNNNLIYICIWLKFQKADEVPRLEPIRNARTLLILGDSITTDHISPAGSIPRNSAAGQYLAKLGYVLFHFPLKFLQKLNNVWGLKYKIPSTLFFFG